MFITIIKAVCMKLFIEFFLFSFSLDIAMWYSNNYNKRILLRFCIYELSGLNITEVTHSASISYVYSYA